MVGTGPNFTIPLGLVLNPTGTMAYVADAGLEAVLGVDLVTGNRKIISSAETSPMTGTGIAIMNPRGIALDPAGETAYLVDSVPNSLFSVNLATGNRTIVSGSGTGAGTDFLSPQDIVLNSTGTMAYVLDGGLGDTVLSVDLVTGDRTVIQEPPIGSGTGLGSPQDIALDPTGRTAYVILHRDAAASFLMGVDLVTGDRTIVSSAGTSPMTGTGIAIVNPTGIALDPAGKTAYLVDRFMSTLLRVDLATGDRTIVSSDSRGTGTGIALANPNGIALDPSGKAYLLDLDLRALVGVDLATGNRTVASSGSRGTGTGFLAPRGVALNSDGDTAYLADFALDALFRVDLTTGNRTIVSSDSRGTGTEFSTPIGVTLDSAGETAYVLDISLEALFRVDLATGNRTIVSDNSGRGAGMNFFSPRGIALNPSGETAYLLNRWPSAEAILAVNLSTGDRFIVSQGRTRDYR